MTYNMMNELKGVMATIRRNLEMVETHYDRLEAIRLITYFSNKTIFHMTKDNNVWDDRMLAWNTNVGQLGLASTTDQVQVVYDSSISLFIDVQIFLEAK